MEKWGQTVPLKQASIFNVISVIHAAEREVAYGPINIACVKRSFGKNIALNMWYERV